MTLQNLHPSARLKLLRESLQLSQREMAQEFKVSSGAIASWELGSNPVPGPIIKLMDIYQLSDNFADKEHERFLKDFKKTIKAFHNNRDDIETIEKALKTYFKDVSFLNHVQGQIKYALARKMVDFLNDGKGLTIKVAQLASYLEMGLPLEIRLAMGNLQSSMKPMENKTLVAILENTYGCSVEKVFPIFDYKPRAVTSLAQVHYAKRINGEEVAVKIQFKDIQKKLTKQFEKIEFLEKINGMLKKDAVGLSEEIKRAVIEECNYLREAKNQEKMRNLLAEFPRAIVPKVHMDLSRPNILVSEYIHAENFHSFAAKASQDSRNVVAEALIRGLARLAFSSGFVMGDVHPENFLIKNDKVVFLDCGRVIHPDASKMRFEVMFYRALILNEKEKAKGLAKVVGFAKDETTFNFEEFWSFLKNSNTHLMRDEKYKFTREYVASITREGRRFASKNALKLTPDAFWAFTFSAGTWGLYAELEAECNWHRIALETFDHAINS